MKKVWNVARRIALFLLAVYLLASIGLSVVYNADKDNAWELAEHRSGLLVIGSDDNSIYILSPFCKWADVFLIGFAWEDGEWWTFSDGLNNFGEF